MKLIPENKTVIQLSQADIRRAVEYWLNEIILKEPCSVLLVNELRMGEGGSFEITFKHGVSEETEK